MVRDSYEDVPRERWSHLWEAVKPDAVTHPVDLPTLGEYAMLRRRRGPRDADHSFPDVAAHLATNCEACRSDFAELTLVAEQELESKLTPLGLTLANGRLIPAAARFRGKPIVSAKGPDQPSGETAPDLDTSFELFRRAIEQDDADAREAIAAQYLQIVAAWIRRDLASRTRISDVDTLARGVLVDCWSEMGSQGFTGFDDLIQILTQLRVMAQARLREELSGPTTPPLNTD